MEQINPYLIDRQIDKLPNSIEIIVEPYLKLNLLTEAQYKTFIDYFKNNSVVYFFDLTNNTRFSDYISSNIIEIKDMFINNKRYFISEINDELSLLNFEEFHYFFPFFKQTESSTFKNLLHDFNTQNFSHQLLQLIKYDGEIKTGIISIFDEGINVHGIKQNESVKEFFEEYLENLNWNPIAIRFQKIFTTHEENDEEIIIDEETDTIIKQLENKISNLTESGQIHLLIPVLENIFKTINVKKSELSTIKIDKVFNIILPEYNMEIKMSHLTKSIYFLFLKHPEGILISDLYLHENELLTIYNNISYQNSLDKIQNTIMELIQADNNEIFVHLSRIKSIFLKQFTNHYAQHYYIKGKKGEVKKIELSREKVFFESEF